MMQTFSDSFDLAQMQTVPFTGKLLMRGDDKKKFIVSDFLQSIQPRTHHDLNSENYTPDQKRERLGQSERFSKILFRDLKQTSDYYSQTQKWRGYVESISGRTFSARLIDLTNGGTEEFSEFDFDDISIEDRSFIAIGATFYMSIGKKYHNKTLTKDLDIRFQRLFENEDNVIINDAIDLFRNLKELL
jgi:hypothetical protein